MSFIHDDFILTNETAKRLYHDYAEKMPIIDYHCHINPKEIYENKKFKHYSSLNKHNYMLATSSKTNNR